MRPEEARKYLDKWEPIMITIGDPLGDHMVPGWKCKTCGVRYGCEVPPSECWKCPKKDEKI